MFRNGNLKRRTEIVLNQFKTTEQIQTEIERLRNSPYVKLAKKAENDMLRQKMYQLRSLEKKGKKIAESLGINFEKEV